MNIWGNTALSSPAYDKIQERRLFQHIGGALSNFVEDLFREDSDDSEYEYFLADNPYTSKQLKWAVKKLMSFYVEKGVIDKFQIPLVVSAPKLVQLEVYYFYKGKKVELKMKEQF